MKKKNAIIYIAKNFNNIIINKINKINKNALIAGKNALIVNNVLIINIRIAIA